MEKIYVPNIDKESAEFFGYEHDENGYYYFYHEQTKEEQSMAWAEYWNQFDKEELFRDCF